MNLLNFLRTIHKGRKATPDNLLPPKYDFWRGDLDLVNVRENDTDRELRLFFERFATSPKAVRDSVRREVSTKRCQELRWFPLRAAVLARRCVDRLGTGCGGSN